MPHKSVGSFCPTGNKVEYYALFWILSCIFYQNAHSTVLLQAVCCHQYIKNHFPNAALDFHPYKALGYLIQTCPHFIRYVNSEILQPSSISGPAVTKLQSIALSSHLSFAPLAVVALYCCPTVFQPEETFREPSSWLLYSTVQYLYHMCGLHHCWHAVREPKSNWKPGKFLIKQGYFLLLDV